MSVARKSAFFGLPADDDAAFVGREWLVDELGALLAQQECRIVALTGGPGVGKTSFLAHLVRRNPEWLSYFIRRDSREFLRSGDAHTFLLEVGCQLAAQRPELFDAAIAEVEQLVGEISPGGEVTGARIGRLRISPFSRVAVRVLQDIAKVDGTLIGVDIGLLEAEARLFSMPDLQHLALVDPARRLAESDPEAKIVVLIDALDEVRFSPVDPDIVRALRELPELPGNLRIVVSSRPEAVLDRLLGRNDVCELKLDPDSENQKADLRLFAERALEKPAIAALIAQKAQSREQVLETLLQKSAGNFLYLTSVLNAIGEAGAEPEGRDPRPLEIRIENLPDDLSGLYAHFLSGIVEWCGRKFGQHVWRRSLRPLLGTMAVAQEPLGAEELALLAGLDSETASDLLRELRQFVARDDGKEAGYRFYHGSFAEFLTSKDRNTAYRVDAESAHRRIGDCLLSYWGGLEQGLPGLDASFDEHLSQYGLRHLPLHLRQYGPCERRLALLGAPSFLRAKIAAGLVFGLVDDLTEAAASVPTGQPEKILLSGIREAVLSDATWLRRNPEGFLTQLYNHLNWELDPSGRCREFAEREVRPRLDGSENTWLRLVHQRARRAFLRLPEPAYPYSRLHSPAIVMPDGTCVIGGENRERKGLVEIWDSRSGLTTLHLDLPAPPEALAEYSAGEVVLAISPFSDSNDRYVNAVYHVDLSNGSPRRICSFVGSKVLALRHLDDNQLMVVTEAGECYGVESLNGERTLVGKTDGPLSAAAIDQMGQVIYVKESRQQGLDVKGPLAEMEEFFRTHLVSTWDPARGHTRELAAFRLSPEVLHRERREAGSSGLISGFRSLAQLPDGRIVLGSSGTDVILMDPDSSSFYRLLVHSSAIGSLAVHPDGRLLVCGMDTALWDLRAASQGETDTASSIQALASLPDDQVLTLSDSRIASVWDPRSGNGRRIGKIRFRNPLRSVVFLRDGTLVETSFLRGPVVAEDLTGNLDVLKDLSGQWEGRSRQAMSVTADRQGNVFFLCPADQKHRVIIKRWHSATGVVTELPMKPLDALRYSGLGSAFAALDDTRFVFAGENGDRILIVDTTSASELDLGGLEGSISGIGITSGGFVVACTKTGTVGVWDPNGKWRTLCDVGGRPLGLACHPDSPYITLALSDGEVLAFTCESGLEQQAERSATRTRRRWRLPYLSRFSRRRIRRMASRQAVYPPVVLLAVALVGGWLRPELLPAVVGLYLLGVVFFALIHTVILGCRTARIRWAIARNAKAAVRKRKVAAQERSEKGGLDSGRLEPIPMSKVEDSGNRMAWAMLLGYFIGDRRRRRWIAGLAIGLVVLVAVVLLVLFPVAMGWIAWSLVLLQSAGLIANYRRELRDGKAVPPRWATLNPADHAMLWAPLLGLASVTAILFTGFSKLHLLWLYPVCALVVAGIHVWEVPWVASLLRHVSNLVGRLVTIGVDPGAFVCRHAVQAYEVNRLVLELPHDLAVDAVVAGEFRISRSQRSAIGRAIEANAPYGNRRSHLVFAISAIYTVLTTGEPSPHRQDLERFEALLGKCSDTLDQVLRSDVGMASRNRLAELMAEAFQALQASRAERRESI